MILQDHEIERQLVFNFVLHASYKLETLRRRRNSLFHRNSSSELESKNVGLNTKISIIVENSRTEGTFWKVLLAVFRR